MTRNLQTISVFGNDKSLSPIKRQSANNEDILSNIHINDVLNVNLKNGYKVSEFKSSSKKKLKSNSKEK